MATRAAQRRTIRQTFGPFLGMRTVTEESASEPRLVQYALNLTCADPAQGTALTVRPPAVTTSGMDWGVCRFFHVFETASGTRPIALSRGGELYVLTGPTTWDRVVTSADFSTAGIVLDPSVTVCYALTFAGTLVVSDGVNSPWMWDGTGGSGGLTSLTACPALYGQPTEYAGKLFGIKAADHRTIVWSEENDATTGYEASGYNNAWTISQQADTPLVRVYGRNDGLYYWRTRSFGVIAGAVAGEFRTTHTHDALSSTVGLAGPGAVADSGDALWWYSSNERIYVYPIGGSVTDISPETTSQHGEDLIPTRVPRWYRTGDSAFAAQYLAASRAALIGPNDVNDRSQVWFSLPGYVVTASGSISQRGNAIGLVYDVTTRRPLSWLTRNPNTSAGSSFDALASFASADGLHGRFAVTHDEQVNAPVFWHWQTINMQGNESGGPVTGTLIGPVCGGDTMAEQAFLRVDAVCRTPAVTGTGHGTLTLEPYTATTVQPTTLSVAISSPATFVAATDPTQASPFVQHVAFGLEEIGRSLRPVFTLTWTAPTNFGQKQGFGIERYSVTSAGVSEDPDAV
jgi:hypothetical protein